MVYESLHRLLLPSACILCAGPGQSDLDLCADCSAELPENRGCCTVCAEPLEAADEEHATILCGSCLRRRWRFRSTHCAFRYDYPVDHLIRVFKYHARIAHSRVLGELLARSLAARPAAPWPQLLLPVPLSKRRFNDRGFNQAMEIAEAVANRLAVPLRTDVLERTRDTAEQAGLERKRRRRNVRNAFRVREPPGAEHVAVVDDVVTTGSTVDEVARVLRRAGVKHIEVWALARATR